MSKTYKFISHVEYNHLVEVADILTVRALPRACCLSPETRPRYECLLCRAACSLSPGRVRNTRDARLLI